MRSHFSKPCFARGAARYPVATLVAILALAMSTPLASATTQRRRAIPPNSNRTTPYALTYGEWSALWWQRALSIPTPENPLLDPTGEKCGVAQMGRVWFLDGTFGGPAERSCTVSASKSFFFPIINAACIEAAGDGVGEEELRACARFLIDHVTVAEASVDGVPLDLSKNRVESPLFSITFPEDNVLGLVDPTPNPSPAVSDGFWVLLAPLPVGEHTVHFRGVAEFPEFGFTFETETTYHLTIVP